MSIYGSVLNDTLIFGQKIRFLKPTIEEIPQPNWMTPLSYISDSRGGHDPLLTIQIDNVMDVINSMDNQRRLSKQSSNQFLNYVGDLRGYDCILL